MKYDGSLTFPILDTPASFPGVYAIAHPPAVRIIHSALVTPGVL